MRKKLSLAAKVFLGKEPRIKRQLNVTTRWYGTPSAGFFIDASQLSKESIVYSFGVGEDISFDTELIAATACRVFGFDPTPKSIKYIESISPITNYSLMPVGLHAHDGFVTFYLPDNPDHVSCTSVPDIGESKEGGTFEAPVKRFATIASELGHRKVNLLKMDIEGSEYEVLDDILSSDVIVEQIAIEFHHRFPQIGKEKTEQAISRLAKAGYKVIAVSQSNEEVTFLKA